MADECTGKSEQMTSVLMIVGVLLVFVSLKNLKNTAGKLSIAVVIASYFFHIGLDLYFN